MFSCEIREIFKNTYFEEHLQMAAPKHLIFKEQSLVRWKHFNYTKLRTCSHNTFSCAEIRDDTKVCGFYKTNTKSMIFPDGWESVNEMKKSN